MHRRFTAAILFWLILMLFSGCTMSNYGKLISNPEVTTAFEKYQVLPGYKYYYRGTYNSPIAIVGIKESYTLDSKLWVAIDPNSKDFRALIDKVSLQGTGSTTHPWGFTIMDKTGHDIGVWYSAIRAAVVETDANGRIVNLSPLRTVTIGDQKR